MKMRSLIPLKRRGAGFTLIEFTIALTVVVILLSIGIPSFRSMIQKNRIATAANEFFIAINLARSEAVMRGSRVDLVPADGVDWAKGWVVFVDQNNNQRADQGEKIIYSHGPVYRELKIKSAFTDSSKPYLAYNGTGRTRTNANSQTPQLGTVSFLLDKQVRRIKLNFVGRPRACNPETDSTCTGTNDTS